MMPAPFYRWTRFVREHLKLSGVRPEREAEIVEDLAWQLEDAYREALAAGANEISARAAAERQISDWAVLSREISDSEAQKMAPITQWQERAEERDLRKLGKFSWLTDLRQDVLYGLRMMRKAPGVTAVALIALALGIGANTAIFSVINAVLLRPLPYSSPERIVAIHNASPLTFVGQEDAHVAWADWADHTQSFERIAAYETGDLNLAAAGATPERVAAAEVSQIFFETFGVSPMAGRVFTREEQVPGHASIAVLSDILCRRFGAPADVLGKTILINGKSTVVIGVMPPGFEFPDKTAVWLPVAWKLNEEVMSSPALFYSVVGRMKPDVSISRGREELAAIVARDSASEEKISSGRRVRNLEHPVEVVSMHDELAKSSRSALLLLLGAVAFVLLIACADVANILLARAVQRQREIALRAALGASRMRLIRQGLTESILLSAIGGAGGLLIADWALHAVRRFIPAKMLFVQNIGLDGNVLIFLTGISVLSGLIFGLFPVLHVMRVDLNLPLKEGAASSSLSRSLLGRSRSLLAIAEMAMAIVLLAGAGLLMKSFWRLMNVDPGFRGESVMTAQIALPGDAYEKASQRFSFFGETLQRIKALPGVTSAAYVSDLPFGNAVGAGFKTQLEKETPAHQSSGQLQIARYFEASPEYFRAMGVSLLAGRAFTDVDRTGAPPVLVVSDSLARAYWPGESALGKRMALPGPPNAPKWAEVVGVVADTKHFTLAERPRPAVFVPIAQIAPESAFLVVRVTGDPAGLEKVVRDEVTHVDSSLPLSAFASMKDRVSESAAEPRFRTLLMGIFAALALILAAAGIYGVMSYNVASRTREIGIRMAMGAETQNVLALVLGQTLRLTLIGVAIGLAAAWGLSRLLASVLYGVAPHDLGTLICVSALLCGVALFASYVPARRAARVDPLIALRHE